MCPSGVRRLESGHEKNGWKPIVFDGHWKGRQPVSLSCEPTNRTKGNWLSSAIVLTGWWEWTRLRVMKLMLIFISTLCGPRDFSGLLSLLRTPRLRRRLYWDCHSYRSKRAKGRLIQSKILDVTNRW